jgi:RNA polymerase sigma-70 factor, ECF subfamily
VSQWSHPVSREADFVAQTDPHRREVLAHCYRMVGSVHDAEDLTQETFLRAWRGYADFEGRSSTRTWLYRIATNVCLNALTNRERRVLPSGLGHPSAHAPGTLAGRLLEVAWLEPIPDPLLGDDPASIVARRDSTRLAFVAALQHLPARQRAALLLRDVVGISAAETAQLLGLSTGAANSALHRARGRIAEIAPTEDSVTATHDQNAALLDRFVAALEQADIAGLAELLRADVELEMPPVPMWFLGRDATLEIYSQFVFSVPRRHVITSANSGPAVASYRLEPDGRHHAHSILLVNPIDGLIANIHAFVDATLFARFGLPPSL